MRLRNMVEKLRSGRTVLSALLVATMLAAAPSAGVAQEDYPSEPIEIIVGFSPGGGTDLIGRAIASGLENQFDVPVQVVNRTGGGGVVGFDALRTAEPDGYTAGIITAQVITANIRGVMDATYEDFELIGMLNIDQAAIVVPADSPYESLDELITAAEENPGSITMGNGGEGGSYHMMARNLEEAADVEFKHVPFDGGPAAILQLVGGHIDAAAVGAVEVAPQVEAGQARVLAVAGQEGDPRFPEFPDTPTTAELGIPLQIGTWRAIGMPKGVDPEIVETFANAVEAAVEDPEFIETMNKANAPIRYFGAERLLEYVQAQEEAYKEILGN